MSTQNSNSVDKDVLREKERMARARAQQEVSPTPFFPELIKVHPSSEDETSRRVRSTLGDFTQVQHLLENDPKHLIGISRSAAVGPVKGAVDARSSSVLPPGHKKNLQNGQRKSSSGHQTSQNSAPTSKKESEKISQKKPESSSRGSSTSTGGSASTADHVPVKSKSQPALESNAKVSKPTEQSRINQRHVSHSSSNSLGSSKQFPAPLNGLLPNGDVKQLSSASHSKKIAPVEVVSEDQGEKNSETNVELETILQEMKLQVPTPLTAIDTPMQEENKFHFSPKNATSQAAQASDTVKSSQNKTKQEKKPKSQFNLREDLAMSDSDVEEASSQKKLSDYPPDLKSPNSNEAPQCSPAAASPSSESSSSEDSESTSESEESDSSACSNTSNPDVAAKTTTQSWGLANFMDKKSSPALALGNSLSQFPGGEKNGDSLVDDDSVKCILSKYPSHDIKEYLKSSSPELLELEPSKTNSAFHALAPFSPPASSPDTFHPADSSVHHTENNAGEDSQSSVHSKWLSFEGKTHSRNRFSGSNGILQFDHSDSKGFASSKFSNQGEVVAPGSPDPIPVPSSPKPSSKHKESSKGSSKRNNSSEKRPKKSELKSKEPETGKKSSSKSLSKNRLSEESRSSKSKEKHKSKTPLPFSKTSDYVGDSQGSKRSKQLKIKSQEYVETSPSSSSDESDVDVVGCTPSFTTEVSSARKSGVPDSKTRVTEHTRAKTPPASSIPDCKPKSKSKDKSKSAGATDTKLSSSKRSSACLLNNSVMRLNFPEDVGDSRDSFASSRTSVAYGVQECGLEDGAEQKENSLPSVMVSIDLALLKRVPPYPPKTSSVLHPEDSIIRQRTECSASRGLLKEINQQKARHDEVTDKVGPRTPKRKAEEKKGHHKKQKSSERKVREEEVSTPKPLERCDSSASLYSQSSQTKVNRTKVVLPAAGAKEKSRHRGEESERKRKHRLKVEDKPTKVPMYKESPVAECLPSSQQDMQWERDSIKSEPLSQNGDVAANESQDRSRDWEQRVKTEYKFLLDYDTRQHNSDYYLVEAKKLKHQADKELNKTVQVMKYLEAVLYFILTGDAMEYAHHDTDKVYTMYKETLALIKYISSRFHKILNSCTGSIDNKLAILSLRCQSLLHLKLYHLRQNDANDIQKSLSEFHKTKEVALQRSPQPPSNGLAPGRLKQLSPCQPRNSVPSPHSPTPSPAGSVASVGSQSSGYSSSELNASQNRVGSNAPPVAHPGNSSASACPNGQGLVTIPQNIYFMFRRQQTYMMNLSLCHDLWEQADRLVIKILAKDFFAQLDEQCGKLSLNSSFPELVHYVQKGLYLLKDNT